MPGHGEGRQGERHVEDAGNAVPADLGEDDGGVVGDIKTDVEESGQKEQLCVPVAGQGALAEQPEDPDGGGQKHEQLEDCAGAGSGPAGPVGDVRNGAEHHERKPDAAHGTRARVEDFGEEAEGCEEVERRQDSVEEIEDGDGREGVDFLRDVEGAVCGLGQQHEGEPEVLAFGVADEKEAEDGQADEAGGDGVGIVVDETDVAGDLLEAFLVFDGQAVAGEIAGLVGSSADVAGPHG